MANRVPFFDRFALVRNLAAVAVLGLLALIPVLRFWRMPGNLLASSLVAWVLFSLTYRILCMNFEGLAERSSAVQIFMLGAVLYMLAGHCFLAWNHHSARARFTRFSSESPSELITNEILPLSST